MGAGAGRGREDDADGHAVTDPRDRRSRRQSRRRRSRRRSRRRDRPSAGLGPALLNPAAADKSCAEDRIQGSANQMTAQSARLVPAPRSPAGPLGARARRVGDTEQFVLYC